MALSEQEKISIRRHGGYLNVAAAATFVLGTPAAMETQFLIETAMNKVLPEAESQVREAIARCDAVLAQILENQDLLAVSAVDEITIRENEFEQLLKRYEFWRNDLMNFLGVYVNPWDKRFYGRSGINVPVR